MQVSTAFGQFQTIVNADPSSVAEARRRRNLFRDALQPLRDVVSVIPSGSLARATQLDPIHDVDLLVEFVPAEHPEWGSPGGSADDALTYLAGQVMRTLGATSGTVANEVRLTSKRNHVVKCFLDDPEAEDPFAVEVAVALRQSDGSLLLPERYNSRWITADPEYLISQVAGRQQTWSDFVPLVRVLKWWRTNSAGLDMKSLAMEVLALRCLPVQNTRAAALAQFFTAAATEVMYGVFDPAGHCGEIQPDLDRDATRSKLLEAAELANEALDAETAQDADKAVALWTQLFGAEFPQPSGQQSAAKPASAVAATLIAPRRRIRDIPQG
ncbi:hypothetical protein ABH920_002762 [Catenulispora sp. EB89]|uniref:hypothetical protein n=1 Tax=Catenulispora sp. EB89 TaxID=3156257 RepID=UPI0035173BE2